MIYYTSDPSYGTNNWKPVKLFKFPGGEIQVTNLGSDLLLYDYLCIKAHIESSDDLMTLLLFVNSIYNINPETKINLIIPYFPYARQDRVCNSGEALSVKVMAELINNLKVTFVNVWDPHSDVTPALLNNVIVSPPYGFIRMIPNLFIGEKISPGTRESLVLVAPDAGSEKKVFSVSKLLGIPFVQAAKIRDTKTGEITNTEVYTPHVGDKDFLIIDDICDGGRTFIELAKKLREKTTGKIYLYVTHGIFSKGLGVFTGLIDKIYCPNVWSNVISSSILEEIKVEF